MISAMARLPLLSAMKPVSSGTTAPPNMAMLIKPDPSEARASSFSQARLKIVGNMIEFIKPIASKL